MSHDTQMPSWQSRGQLDEERQKVLNAIEQWGDHATCFQLLEPGFHYWFDPLTGAVVGYTRWWRYWLVAGPPVAPCDAMSGVVGRFLSHVCRARGRALFVSVEADWLDALGDLALDGNTGWDRISLGVQPEWSLPEYSTDTPAHKTLRSQVRRAQRKGAVVTEVFPVDNTDDAQLARGAVEKVVQQWLSTRTLSPLRFMVTLAPYHLASSRRFFLAEVEGLPVALLIAIPVPARNGWFIEDLLRASHAPNGTVELLVHTAMTSFRDDSFGYCTLGLSPLAHGEELDPQHPLLTRLQHCAYNYCNWLYQFAGLYSFKKRFVPQKWQRQYLACHGRKLGVLDFVALLRVMLGPGWLGFLFDSVRRRWSAASGLVRWGCISVLIALTLVVICW